MKVCPRRAACLFIVAEARCDLELQRRWQVFEQPDEYRRSERPAERRAAPGDDGRRSVGRWNRREAFESCVGVPPALNPRALRKDN